MPLFRQPIQAAQTGKARMNLTMKFRFFSSCFLKRSYCTKQQPTTERDYQQLLPVLFLSALWQDAYLAVAAKV